MARWQVPPGTAFAAWDGSVAGARALQVELATRVVLQDGFATPLRWIGGLDVGFEDGGRITRAAAVLLDAKTLQPADLQVARIDTVMPYVPGLLSFRELPALIQALAQLPRMPDLVFLDGQGIAHPRRFGVAAHFGVATGLPSIGVAKKLLCGEHAEPGPQRGDATPLLHAGDIIGTVLRSKERCRPLIVSPGHLVSVASAAPLVMRFVTGYRLPEPTRLADRLASRRSEV